MIFVGCSKPIERVDPADNALAGCGGKWFVGRVGRDSLQERHSFLGRFYLDILISNPPTR